MKLSIDQLGKIYGSSFWGLRDFSLELGPCIVGLLGPNGAGKSTLMRILATITKPTEGRVLWNNIDISKQPDALRQIMGYLPQDFGIYPNLTAQEFLEYMAAIKGLNQQQMRQRIDELLQVVNLTDARKRQLKGFSGGMKQRIGIAQALLNDPTLLIIDEPTVGLDPEERVRFRSLLTDLSGERIILLSTHIVSDVEATATDIVIMNKGHMLIHASSEQLLQGVDGKVWEWMVKSSDLPLLREHFSVSSAIHKGDGVHVRIISDASPGRGATQTVATLEDAYLYYVSRQPVQARQVVKGKR